MQIQKNAWNTLTKMKKEINFSIKKGVYCSWCAELMKKTLNQHFALREIDVDVPKEKVHLITCKRVNPLSIIIFLKKRGYYLVEETI